MKDFMMILTSISLLKLNLTLDQQKMVISIHVIFQPIHNVFNIKHESSHCQNLIHDYKIYDSFHSLLYTVST